MENMVQKEAIAEQKPLTPRDALSCWELMMIGSSEYPPGGGQDPYIMDRVIKENFPEWVFSAEALKTHTLEEVNDARKEGFIFSETLGPLNFSFNVAENCTFQIFLGKLGLSETEFGLARWDDEEGKSATEIKRPGPIGLIRIEEKYKPFFKLKPVPDHPERRYLVPVRKP
ncbi:MAG: hypothetical protein AAB414_03210 [Patescibacteria group bacterium]